MKVSNLGVEISLTFFLGCGGFPGSFFYKKITYKTKSV